MASLNDIRSTFLSYFSKQDHKIVQASPLVPRNDPTLMFVNSGMVQFKNLFTGLETRDYQRAASSQKCVRAGGKHNDLDNVGYTARHHTFFEMLGNFSFGDYFKEEAIYFAWELLTKEFDLNKNRLLVTIYHTDDEAFGIWKKISGLPDEKVIRIKTNDNFWMMGATGPCGPCTEIFYDHGEKISGGPPGSSDEDGDRYIEIWNLVFMQNEKLQDGRLLKLGQQSIDTGMGLERIGAVLQGKHDNYETDLFRSLIEVCAEYSDRDPDGSGKMHHRVISDHLRSSSFLIADGVLPSNEGRGYVLRRIMRRAMRHAHLLGVKDPLMHRLVPVLVGKMGGAYPELGQAEALIEETLRIEETRFMQTLDRGLKLLDEALSKLGENAHLPGETAFKLYDTYGFPLDLTEDALREKGRTVDVQGFHEAMSRQKSRARATWAGSGEAADNIVWFDMADQHGVTEFLGYDLDTVEAKCLAIIKEGSEIDKAVLGDEVQLVFNQTPFYAESGGQVGDSGSLTAENVRAEITDTKKIAGVFVHLSKIKKGIITVGDSVLLTIDGNRRKKIRSNHSATHLLHEALKRTLGNHVAQRGSLNADDRLRFDFSHSKALSIEEISQVESDVNEYIRQNSKVNTLIMAPNEAREIGAQALFGEKYGDEVRVVSMGKCETSMKGKEGKIYSLELCGGTHVEKTGDIGVFITTSDSANSSGVRRIEALTGEAAYQHISEQMKILSQTAGELKSPAASVPERIKTLLEERRLLRNEITLLKRDLAMLGGSTDEKRVDSSNSVAGIKFYSKVLNDVSGKELPSLVDEHKLKLGSGIVLLMAEANKKVSICVGVTDDLTHLLSAVDIVKASVPFIGGNGGGGRPDLARGGGNDLSQADVAIKAVASMIKRKMETVT